MLQKIENAEIMRIAEACRKYKDHYIGMKLLGDKKRGTDVLNRWRDGENKTLFQRTRIEIIYVCW